MAGREEITGALRAAREAKGLSQRALAARAGLPQSHISKIESGAVDLQLSSLIELARVLELEVKLVPRKALSAVESIVRSTAPTIERSHQARIQEALYEAANVASRLTAYDRSQSLQQIAENADFLRRSAVPLDRLASIEKALEVLAPLKRISLDTHHEEDISALLAAPKTAQGLKKAARVIQTIRNQAAHRFAESVPPRPAYGAEEEEGDE